MARAPGLAPHWGLLHPGRIMLRDDSAMNLGPEMYREFILPYNDRLLRAFGGGAVHACGKVDHWLPVAAGMPGLLAFNLSQPHLNDMEAVFAATTDRGIPLIGLERKTGEAGARAKASRRGCNACW